MELTREQKRVIAVTLKKEGVTNKEIAKKTGLTIRGIQTINKRVKQTQSFKEKPRTGRPGKITDRDKRLILRILKSKQAGTATEICKVLKTSHKIEISRQTVARVLNSFGFSCRIKKKKPRLTVKHRKDRLHWAKEHEAWTTDDWRKVIWSDESKFNLLNSDGKEYYWTNRPAEITDDSVKPTVKFGGGGVMVWSCITWEGNFNLFLDFLTVLTN
jgi:transposase